MRIIHLADIHILNFLRHDEYKEYFQIIFEQIVKLKPDVVLLAGDIFHMKTNLSPDVFNMVFDFLEELSLLTKVVIIPGNHDVSEKNLERLDAISPVVQRMPEQCDILYFKKSEDYYVFNKSDLKYRFRVFSLLDKENYNFSRKDIPEDEVIIGLFHGGVKGCSTDLGWIFEHGEELEKFEQCCDYLLMGDIHKQQFFNNKRFAYSGIPWQHNFGDGLKKGFLLWDIDSREKFDVQFIEIPNLYPFITVNYGDKISIPEESKKVRLRLITDQDTNKTQEYISEIRKQLQDKLFSLAVFNQTKSESLNETQSRVISFADYIKENKNKDELLKIHQEYLSQISSQINQSNWKINKLKWNNFFSFGQGNELDFNSFEGKSILISGSNFSGKTSTLKLLCFALFGEIPKPFVKNLYLINDVEDFADCYVEFSINNSLKYSIYRKLEKVKKGKNLDCKSSLEFRQILGENNFKNLNGVDITATQVEICNLIGTFEDFQATSLSTQFNNFSLIDEKNTKRKEYFSKFLGITQYEEISYIVKNDIKDLKKEIDIIKKYDDVYEKYDKLKIVLPEKLEEVSDRLIVYDIQREEWKQLEKEFKKIEKEYKEQYSQQEVLNLLNKQKTTIKNNIDKSIIDMNKAKEQIKDVLYKEGQIEEIKEIINNNLLKINKAESETTLLEKQLKEIEESEELLKSVPCQNSFPECKFLIKANSKLKDKKELKSLIDQNKSISVSLGKINETYQNTHLKYSQDSKLIYEKNQLNLKNIESLEKKIVELSFQLNDLEKDILEKEEKNVKNEEIEKKYNQIKSDIEILRAARDANYLKFKTLESEIKILMEQKFSLETKIGTLKEKTERLDLLEQYSELVGKNGIIVSILNVYIPQISNLMNNIINNIVDFKTEIKIEDDKIEIYLEDNISRRLIETCSGSQKMLIAYAFRLAILQFSQICSSNLLILDEPGTALDSDRLLEFSKILDIAKSIGKTILMVTHIEQLKECADESYTIDKSSGYSKIIG